jgi:hypothetical protein
MGLLADYNIPFAAALLLMVLLALAQSFGPGGFEMDADGDVELDAGGDLGFVDGLLSLIGIGRLPFMMWLALFLLLFAAIGVSAQALAESLTGAPLDITLGAALAAIGAVPVTGLLARPLAAIVPKDETTAVSTDSLVGRRARISIGRAAAGFPARAVVHDRFGQMHNVMVEPHESSVQFIEGEDVLLVRREGETFFAIALQNRQLSPTG